MNNENRITGKGRNNLLTDVQGVKVGHCTVSDGRFQTGATAVLPHPGNIFEQKVIAGCRVINGFGKSAGLMQIDELGTIETPIILTSTLSVGVAFDSVVRYMIKQNPGIGREDGTVNPIITECNDGYLNDVRSFPIKEEHVLSAIENAGDVFEIGSVGAGRGMSCYEFKGGIGSASRTFEINGTSYTLGALVNTNFGKAEDLVIDGKHICKESQSGEDAKGSCIIVIATDAPLSSRQLKRVASRSVNGLARTGCVTENGSGEIGIAFSTANKIGKNDKLRSFVFLNDSELNVIFKAVSECVEESVLRSLFENETVTGFEGHTRSSLKEFLNKHN